MNGRARTVADGHYPHCDADLYYSLHLFEDVVEYLRYTEIHIHDDVTVIPRHALEPLKSSSPLIHIPPVFSP